MLLLSYLINYFFWAEEVSETDDNDSTHVPWIRQAVAEIGVLHDVSAMMKATHENV